MTRRSRRLAAYYCLEMGGLDKRQQRRLLRRTGRLEAVLMAKILEGLQPVTGTPWSDPSHDVLGDTERIWDEWRARDYFVLPIMPPVPGPLVVITGV